MISYGLNRAFGTMLRRIISNSTRNRVKAFFVGIGVAAVLQSSTATSLIVSSFAARSVITVSAAIAVMLGADVGTTLAAQFMSLNMSWLAPSLIIIGYIVSKTMEETQYKHVGRAIVGMGLALVALKMITTVAEPLKHSEALQALIGPLASQPVLAVIISALLTWLVHSSLGMVLLYMSFVGSGTLPVELGLYMVLGANIGGALAPVIMTLRDMPAGRRVPLGNLLIRGLGVVLILPFMGNLILPFISSIHPDPGRMMVNFHTAFNLGVALIFLPFIGSLTRVSEIILPDRPRDEDESLPRYLDPTAITTPPAALACVARETLRVADIVQRMLLDTLGALRVNNARLVMEIRNKEDIVDSLYVSIKTYLARLSGEALGKEESRRYMQVLTFSTNLEHIGDIIDKSLMEMAMKKIRNQDNFSRQGFAEITELHGLVMENMQLAQNVFMTGDISMARKMFEAKGTMRDMEARASESHFKRLSEGVAETIATSSLHMDILRDFRQINSYITTIAYPILEEANELNPLVLKTPGAGAKGREKPVKRKKPDAPLPEKY
jgi:phosphate:Na+ symporter